MDMNKQHLIMYFDMEDMCWYFGGQHETKGFHWCQDMRHSTLFNGGQVETIRETLKATAMDGQDFQTFQKV